MIDKAVVIDGLGAIRRFFETCQPSQVITFDSYQNIIDGAIELIRDQQEARVMTLGQLEDALDTVVWLETPVSENLADGYSLITGFKYGGYMCFNSPFRDEPSEDSLDYSEYGKSWRCWDRRPFEEQRKAVKWE